MTIQAFSQEQVRSLRTARFSERAHAVQSELPTERVRIKFLTGAFNTFFRRNECLFYVYAGDDDSTTSNSSATPARNITTPSTALGVSICG